MTTSSIDLSTVVQVSILSSPTYPALTGFGVPLIVGSTNYLPSGNRMRFYTSMTGVAADFPTSSQEYAAANVAFSQSPAPSTVAIGRRFPNGAPAELLGSVNYTKTLATWQAITAGSFVINLDGGAVETVSNLNFSGVSSLAGVATIINTALNAALAGATCTYNGTQFIIRGALSNASGSVTYTTASASGTYIGMLLGTDATQLGTITTGQAVETVPQSLTNLQNYNAGWYGFHFTNEVQDSDLLLAMAWVMGYKKIMGYTTADSNVQASVTTDIASQAMAAGYTRVFGMWDQNNSYSALSAMARMFTVNFQGQNTTITIKFKTLPGQIVQQLSETQREILDGKNINYYTYYGGVPMVAEGVMADGTWFDQIYGLDWLQNYVENQVFGYIYSRPTKIPQTDKGTATVKQQVDQALNQAVINGLLAKGLVWNGQPLGQVNTGDILDNGFYTYVASVNSQSQVTRSTRVAPPIQGIMNGAGAIQGIAIALTFQQ